MSKVEKSHPGRSWDKWACAREDFAVLLDEAAAIIGAETGSDVDVEVRVPGFERLLNGTAEFRENVTEGEWLVIRSVEASVASGDSDGRVYAYVDALTGTGFLAEAHLSLRGRDRRSRNAIWPDLIALMEKHERQKYPTRGRFGIAAVSVGLLVGIPMVVGGVAGLRSLGDSIGLSLAVATALNLALNWFVGGWLAKRADQHLRAVELLPDNGRGLWDQERARWLSVGRVLLAGALAAATIAAAVFAGIAAL